MIQNEPFLMGIYVYNAHFTRHKIPRIVLVNKVYIYEFIYI